MNDVKNELKAALGERAPSPEEASAWARAAVNAPTESRKRVLLPVLLTAALLLIAATVALWVRGNAEPGRVSTTGEGTDDKKPGPDRNPTREETMDDPAPTIESQRAIHLRYLLNNQRNETVRNAKPGTFVMVAGMGEDLNVWTGPNLDELLKRCARTFHPPQRFAFKIGPDTFPVQSIRYPASGTGVGAGGAVFVAAFGAAMHTSATGGPLKNRRVKGDLELLVGAHKIPFAIKLNAKLPGPALIPDALCDPRFEIPGELILPNEDGVWRTYRRYFLRMRHAPMGLDAYLPCAGKPQITAVEIHDTVWHKLERTEVAEAQLEPDGEPLLVLDATPAAAGRVARLFRNLPNDALQRLARVRSAWHVRTEPGANDRTFLRRYATTSELMDEFVVPKDPAKAQKLITAFLRRIP